MAERVTVGQVSTKLDMLISLINERHAEYEKNREVHIKEHSDINALLRGRNGTPGLVEEVHGLQKFCERHEAAEKAKKNERWQIISLTVSSLMALAVAIISIVLK